MLLETFNHGDCRPRELGDRRNVKMELERHIGQKPPDVKETG